MNTVFRFVGFATKTVVPFATMLLLSRTVSAQTIIKDPNPPKYGVEIEPKFNIGGASGFLYDYGGTGFGPGVRFSIPIYGPGFIKTINDSIAITFGPDLIRYNGYSYGNRCDPFGRNCYGSFYGTDFWALYVPVALQWNFWLTTKWSVMAEPGIAFRHAFFPDTYCDPRVYVYGCDTRSRDDIYFAFFAGGRYHFSDNMALTMRIGHPILFSIGLSIFP